MISARSTPDGTVFVGDLPRGSEAFVDADWVTHSTETALPFIVAANGSLRSSWGGEAEFGDIAPLTALALEIGAAADAAVAAIRTPRLSNARTEVVGAGVIANEVRRRLPAADLSGDATPLAIIDVTGDPSRISDAVARVADGGTVVLSGVSAGRRTSLSLYPDAHVRGLCLTGTAPILAGHKLRASDDAPDLLPPVESVLGQPVASGSWYRIVPDR